jgi:hypothetical protein
MNEEANMFDIEQTVPVLSRQTWFPAAKPRFTQQHHTIYATG